MKQNSGNVLFMILAGIVLFAGLTYAVTQANESGENVDQEQLRIDIAEFISNMEVLRTTIGAMKARGIADNQISFEYTGGHAGYVNANCTSDACRIFHPSGGGLTYVNAADSISTDSESIRFNGSDPFHGHGTDGASAASSDLFARVATTEAACIEYNRMVDFTDFVPNTGPDVQIANLRFGGTYTYNSYEVDEAEYYSVKTFCTQHPTNHGYSIYYVLLAR